MTLQAIVCHPLQRACWSCDARQPHTPEKQWIITPEGRVYCTLECHDDWEAHLADMDAKIRCCPECGFDQQEHNEGCSLDPARTP